MSDCVQNISETRYFYDAVEQLYNFFGRSIKCWPVLKELASVSEVNGKVTTSYDLLSGSLAMML
jgi:hypothetical protein